MWGWYGYINHFLMVVGNIIYFFNIQSVEWSGMLSAGPCFYALPKCFMMLESVTLVAHSCITWNINHTYMTSTPCGVGDPIRFWCALLYKKYLKPIIFCRMMTGLKSIQLAVVLKMVLQLNFYLCQLCCSTTLLPEKLGHFSKCNEY